MTFGTQFKRSLLVLGCGFVLLAFAGAQLQAPPLQKVNGSMSISGDLSVEGRMNGVDVRDIQGRVVPVGAILPFAGRTAPKGWIVCDGSEVAGEHEALRQLLKEDFTVAGKVCVPDLRGRTIFGMGKFEDQGKATAFEMAKPGGHKHHTLTLEQIPAHTHTHELALTKGPGSVKRAGPGDRDSLTGNVSETGSSGGNKEKGGKTDSFDILPPYLVLNYIIKH